MKFTVEEEEEEGQESGLLVELEGKDEKKERETSLWFSKVCHIVFRLLFQKRLPLHSQHQPSAINLRLIPK